MVARCSLFSEGLTYRSCTLSQRQRYLYLAHSLMTFQSEDSTEILNPKPSKSDPSSTSCLKGWLDVSAGPQRMAEWYPVSSLPREKLFFSQPPPRVCLWLAAINRDCARLHVDSNSHSAIRTHLFKALILMLFQEAIQLVHIHSYSPCVYSAMHCYSKSSLNNQWWARECGSVVDCFPCMLGALDSILITVGKSDITVKMKLLIKKAAKMISSIPGNQCACFRRDLVKTKFVMP